MLNSSAGDTLAGLQPAETPATTRPRRTRDATVFASRYFHRMQLRHFVLLDILPAVGTVAALLVARTVPISALDIGLFFALWLLTGLGITVGYHRLFTHRAFSTSEPVAVTLQILGAMAGRGPAISWSAFHRRHHELSDREGDSHSPMLHGSGWRGRLRGFWHAQLTWMARHDYPNVHHYVPDLMADRTMVRVNKYYYLWVLAGLAIPALIGGLLTQSLIGALTGFLWGGVVRMFVVAQSISAINSFSHLYGARPFQTRGDNSRNNWIVSLFTWGEGWHNNHHAFPYSAAFGHSWRQFDLGFLTIRLFEKLGLVWDVKRPAPQRIAARRARPE